MSVALVLCKCSNEFQDKRYGKQTRIANGPLKDVCAAGRKKVRCTVCGSVHEVHESTLKK
jgi:hypothetical protein